MDKRSLVGILVIGLVAIRRMTAPQMINLAYYPFILSLGSGLSYFAEKRMYNQKYKKVLETNMKKLMKQ